MNKRLFLGYDWQVLIVWSEDEPRQKGRNEVASGEKKAQVVALLKPDPFTKK